MAYKELGRTLVKRKFATLNLLTLGNHVILGFACEGHQDVNDWFVTINDVGKMINSYIDEVCELNLKRYKDIIELNNALLKKKRKRTIQHFDKVLNIYVENLYLIRHMTMLHDLQTKRGWYEKPTMCG